MPTAVTERTRRTPGPAVEGRLDREGHERFHVGRRHPLSLDQHRHGRCGEVRQHVDRHPRRHVATPDEEGGRHGEHDETVSQRPLNEPVNHHRLQRNTRRTRLARVRNTVSPLVLSPSTARSA